MDLVRIFLGEIRNPKYGILYGVMTRFFCEALKMGAKLEVASNGIPNTGFCKMGKKIPLRGCKWKILSEYFF